MIVALAEAVSAHVPKVRVAFADVLGPSPATVLRDLDEQAVVVPAFLASGFHVHSDVPRGVAESGHGAATVTKAMGPDVVLARVMHRRLRESGWRPGDAVVLAAAGSWDPRARQDVRRAAAMLTSRVGGRVGLAYIATGMPKVPDVIARLRATEQQRVFIASYLLAHGLFQQRLRDVGADGVAEPLGVHPEVVGLLVDRYTAGVRELAAVRVARGRARPIKPSILEVR